MYQSHVISLPINRPAREVYAFLAEPMNFPKWAVVVGPHFRQIGPHEWVGDSPTGDSIVRFCERNTLGVLDHAVYHAGEEPVMMPMRVFPNGKGCELTFCFFRRPGMTDEQFSSAIEWITTDFQTLQSLLEV
ncbi:MAG: hypothetical protein P4M09_15935 [Devosia sp.]|nr:hypothetical protein [Devosia sp.]